MAFKSIQTHVSDGTLESVQFSIAFLSMEHLHFYVDDVEITTSAASQGVMVDGVDEYGVTLTAAVPSGAVFKVQRQTPRDNVPHVFSTGAALFTALTTDANNEYLLYVVQETYEQSGQGPFPEITALVGTEYVTVEAGGVRKQITVQNFLTSVASTAALVLDLANTTDPEKGAGMLGYSGRTVYDRLQEFVYPEDKGAVADGVTEDTAAVQAAINTGRCRLTPGKAYAVANLVIQSSDTVIVGENSKLVPAFGTTGVVLTVRPLVDGWANKLQRVVLEGFTIDCTGHPAVKALQAKYVERLDLLRLNTKGGDSGADIQTSAIIYAERCHFEGSAGIGCSLVSDVDGIGTWAFFDKCVFAGNFRGFYTKNVPSVWLRDCLLFSNSEIGGYADAHTAGYSVAPTYFVVDSCDIDSNGSEGFVINGWRNVVASKNWISGGRTNTKDGLLVNACTSVDLLANKANHNGASGIAIIDSWGVRVTGGECNDNQFAGVKATGGGNIRVTDVEAQKTIYQFQSTPQQYGITLTGGTNNTIKDPICYNNAAAQVVNTGGNPCTRVGDIGFGAYPSAAQATVGSTASKKLFATEDYDTSASYDAAASRFVAPFAGIYNFSAGAALDTANTWLSLKFYKNGSAHSVAQNTYNSATSSSAYGACQMYLTAGDYVEVFVTTGANSNIIANADLTYFRGQKA